MESVAQYLGRTMQFYKSLLLRLCFGFLLLSLALFGGGYVVGWLFPASPWAIKWYYEFTAQDIRNPEFAIDRRPHDCDFWTAPIGDKNCHYEREVRTLRLKGDKYSMDEGVTWQPTTLFTRSMVWVSWKKVDD